MGKERRERGCSERSAGDSAAERRMLEAAVAAAPTQSHLIRKQAPGQEVQPQPGGVFAQNALALLLDRFAQQPVPFLLVVDIRNLGSFGSSALLAPLDDKVLNRLLVRLHAHAALVVGHLLRLFVVCKFLQHTLTKLLFFFCFLRQDLCLDSLRRVVREQLAMALRHKSGNNKPFGARLRPSSLLCPSASSLLLLCLP